MTETSFGLDVDITETATVLIVSGDLDAVSAPVLRGEIVRQRGAGRHLVLDCAGLRFVDSTGLSVLVAALKGAREAGRRFALCNVRGNVRVVLALTLLERVFDRYNSRAAALTAMRGEGAGEG